MGVRKKQNNNIAKLAELSSATGIGRSQMTSKPTAWVEIGNRNAPGADLSSDKSISRSQLNPILDGWEETILNNINFNHLCRGGWQEGEWDTPYNRRTTLESVSEMKDTYKISQEYYLKKIRK